MGGKGVLILSFFFSPGIGGVETHLNDLCSYLSSAGRRTRVVTFQPLTSSRTGSYIERSGALTVYRLPSPVHNMFYRFQSATWLRFILLTPMLLAASAVVMAFHRKEIGIVHAHDLNSALAAALLSWLFGTRSVITVHYVQDFLSASSATLFNRLGRRVLSHFDAVIAVSNRVGAELDGLLDRPERLHRMTYWIDLSLFSPVARDAARERTGLGEGFTAVFVGRFTQVKGVPLLLDACRLLAADCPRVVFVGEGPLLNDILSAQNQGLNVLCAGPVRQEQLRDYYSAADIVVVPSVYEEGYGRVAMEALACGTPVIGSARGAIPELLSSAVGRVVEPDARELSASMLKLMNDPGEMARMKSNCRRYAEERFGIANAAAVTDAYGA